MARRKITEEAAERDQVASSEASSTDDEPEREQLTQRMPPDLREELDRVLRGGTRYESERCGQFIHQTRAESTELAEDVKRLS